MLIASRSRGFTIIELMIAIALFSVVLMLAMPSFTTMLQNAKLRAKAESILAGLQEARTEALKQNQTVEFLLMAEDPDPTNVAGFGANAAGPSWAVRVDAGGGAYSFVEGRSGLEGSGQADPAALYAQVSAANLPVTTTIRFDALGRSNVNAVTCPGAASTVSCATFDVKPAAPGECKADGGTKRCLRVVVTPGGRVRMCDPSVDGVANPGDTRAC
jgi:type IV fimbrial biogenesis protein FimT